MISVLLKGGLGNQLFQYSFGMASAIEYGVDLTLCDHLARSSSHDYVLGSFNIDANFRKSFYLPYAKSESKFSQQVNKLMPWINLENDLVYDSKLIHNSLKRLSIGYFQSAKYFDKYRKQLLSNLTLKHALQCNIESAIQTDTRDETSVAVHIRRGDFLTEPGASKVHGFVGEKYYINAAQLIASRLNLTGNTPLFLVFSDDPIWAANFFGQSPYRFRLVSSDKFNAAQELYLMSKCSHNVLANSSFSWWGSYLNSNRDKVTVAPKRWYADNRAHSIHMDGWDLL